jgi:hypothetical protein
MKTIVATQPSLEPPLWAVLEREVFTRLNAAITPYLDRYTLANGHLRWGGTAEQHGRDDIDDFYEAFYNWPLLYLLGGDDRLLALSHRQWEAITEQLTGLGLLEREFERGADHFHQGESLLYFYFLCLADPDNQQLQQRTERFANFYTGADPLADNYDPLHQIIRAPHNGSLGPRWGYTDGDPSQIVLGWHDGMEQFGLPFADIAGAESWAAMQTPAGAAAMGAAMQQRFGRGDVSTNLMVTSLVANAYLLTGKTQYQAWVLQYVGAWQQRAANNQGFLPDNVGPNGIVGEDFGGRWYGGLYGWQWPHGFYNVGMSATIAASNAYLLSGQDQYLDLARWQLDGLLALADAASAGSSAAADTPADTQAEPAPVRVPYRINDGGWFDWQRLPPLLPTALWNISMQPADAARLARLRRSDWRQIEQRRGKEDAGHEGQWLEYLAGRLPHYPETILRQALGHLARRLALIAADQTDLEHLGDKNVHLYVHLWQQMNPVTTEALVQLTLGGPQHVYNGGLLHARVRYFDALRQRPGLPADVAALVSRLEADHTTLTLVNLSPQAERQVLLQAGVFGEHGWGTVRYQERVSEYPGPLWAASAPPLAFSQQSLLVDAAHLLVILPPASEITLELETHRALHRPSYLGPHYPATQTKTAQTKTAQTEDIP